MVWDVGRDVTSASDRKCHSVDCKGTLVLEGEPTLIRVRDNKQARIFRTGLGTTILAYSGDGARVKEVGGDPFH